MGSTENWDENCTMIFQKLWARGAGFVWERVVEVMGSSGGSGEVVRSGEEVSGEMAGNRGLTRNANNHPSRQNPSPYDLTVDFKPKILPPMGIKGIAKLARGWFLGCDQALDCKGSGEDNEQCRVTVYWRETSFLAMEGLCTTLMILPKEIKSLKARVYKLETIIISDKDGEFFSFNVSPHQSANKDPVNELVDALDDLVDESGVGEVEKDLSKDDGLKVQKLEVENKRLAEQKRIRFHKMKEQENDMKSSYFSNSIHMKLTLEKCGTNKRKFANVL
nr:hypothetical protein [Tanacetum cinerariifolium]